MSEEAIHIRNARTNNLKGIDVTIPRNQLVVITGVSGSGKSSLAFDTLYAEGQRRYVESLSSYARQFLGRMQKPDVDEIEGIPPAIAIEQKVSSRNPRSTVGTVTEIYDYLKLLYARAGETRSPKSGTIVKRHTVSDVVKVLSEQAIGTRVLLLAPAMSMSETDQRPIEQKISEWLNEGYARLLHVHENNEADILRLTNTIAPEVLRDAEHLYLLVDRVIADGLPTTLNRFADSVQAAFYEGHGQCIMRVNDTMMHFSERFEADGIRFEEPSEHLFNFNNPLGACPTCNGFGNIVGIDPDLVVPDKGKSIYEDAIVCCRGETMSAWRDELIQNASKFDFPIHKPFYMLTDEQKQLIWTGNEYFKGLNQFFHMLEQGQYAKMQYRVMLARFRGKTVCPDCNGLRLRREANYVWIGDKRITDVIKMTIREVEEWLKNVRLDKAFDDLKKEIDNRLQFMEDVGLSYLTLNRGASTLSGGESQRINLAKSLGSSLVGSLYVLDEPSIGLHARDTERLIRVLRELRDLGNTIVVVEHDEDIIMAADYMIEIGPAAGSNGGEVVYAGKPRLHNYPSVVPENRRHWSNYIEVQSATENNLKHIDVRFPLNVLTVITGVSGSGKSSLVRRVLYPALRKYYGGIAPDHTGDFGGLKGSLQLIQNIEYIDQNPISTSSRSNPVTYIKAWDEIRKLYAEQQLSKQMGFTPTHFSFNAPGGRCETCQGEGTITIEMQFMADIVMECEECHGKRFKPDVLEVLYKGKNIHDILELTVDEAIALFSEDASCQKIVKRLQPLQDVGIGYVKLGQASSTLSGGECQRVKLADFLSKEDAKPTMFVFDEPTTGLHHRDVLVLLKAFNRLISKGHTVVIIEHNPTVIMAADHIIDLGPEGGVDGGYIVAEGTPEHIAGCANSYTGRYLKTWLA